MTFTEEQVEWIVLEVLRRLGVVQPSQQASGSSAELRVDESLVTMRLLEGRLNGVSRMVVHPGAVITPAVKDELRQRKIELVRKT